MNYGKGAILSLSAFFLTFAVGSWLVSAQSLYATNWAYAPFVAGLIAFALVAWVINKTLVTK